jgi:hypothetical protein
MKEFSNLLLPNFGKAVLQFTQLIDVFVFFFFCNKENGVTDIVCRPDVSLTRTVTVKH